MIINGVCLKCGKSAICESQGYWRHWSPWLDSHKVTLIVSDINFWSGTQDFNVLKGLVKKKVEVFLYVYEKLISKGL